MDIAEKKVGELTAEELEQLLEKRKKEQAAERKKAKESYENNRNDFVSGLVNEALDLEQRLKDFKVKCFIGFENFREEAHNYGDIRTNSKGGFSLRNNNTGVMARLERNVKFENDERLDIAIPLIKEFLEDTVKKRSLADYKTISALMAKNKKGDFSTTSLNILISQKTNYDDKRWLRAIELIEESFVERGISYSVSFFTKGDTDKDEAICLNFAALKVELPEVKKEV
jgi:hypothetical protein